jgi:hypothetical protein
MPTASVSLKADPLIDGSFLNVCSNLLPEKQRAELLPRSLVSLPYIIKGLKASGSPDIFKVKEQCGEPI